LICIKHLCTLRAQESWAQSWDSSCLQQTCWVEIDIDTTEIDEALCGWGTDCDAAGGEVFNIALAAGTIFSKDFTPGFAGILCFGADFRSAVARD
jgi:hypothetical protein